MSLSIPASVPVAWQRLPGRGLPFIAILFAHLGLFYLLQHSLASKAPPLFPKETVISLIQAVQAPHEPAKPLPKQPKNLSPQLTLNAPVPEIVIPATNQTTEPSISVVNTPSSNSTAVEALAPVAVAALPKLVSGVEYLQAPQPDYPPLARRMGQQGKVTLRVLVNQSGRAEKVEIQQSSGFNRLDEAARLAILRALFKPYVEDGKALMMLATATINFSLSS